MDLLEDKIDEGTHRLLGVNKDDLQFLQGYVSALRDTLEEVRRGEFS